MRPAAFQPSTQISGLAAIRALGCVLIVLGHAGIPYMTQPPTSIAWPVHDEGLRGCDLLYLWCRGSQCGFFILSGIMAAAALRHGVREFSRARLRLLGRPLLIALLTILPLCYLVWMLGWWRTGYITLGQLLEFRLATEDKRKLLGLAHLWYLEYLLIYSLIYALWRRVRASAPRAVSAASLLAIVGVAAVWCTAWALFDPAMILDFRNSFVPRLSYLAYNGAFFAVGVMLWSARASLPQSRAPWIAVILGAHAVFVAWIALEARAPLAATTTVAAVVFAVLNSVGFTGLAFISRWDPGVAAGPIRALVRGAYFVYLTHLPIVGAANIALWGLQLHSAGKFAVSACIGLGVPLVLHRFLRKRRSGAGSGVEMAHSSPAS